MHLANAEILELQIFNERYIFYKQLIYKQVALGWQIAKQLSGFNPLYISSNKNNRSKKSRNFPLK